MKYTRHFLFLILTAYLFAGCLHEQKSMRNPLIIKANSDKENLFQNNEERRQELFKLLGRLPARNRPMSVKLMSREETDEMIIEKL